ncbi:hypothetical protein XELAEV_18010086mg [Xenopus laevis]|uniref:Uncharacterized protein n=1 Tax=Xenopus laevis TaxID=8355 RepID=A0A974DTW1_XENLA|nr:hypothetical protein XELAEV_18010086mg [Xenopus laevis]
MRMSILFQLLNCSFLPRAKPIPLLPNMYQMWRVRIWTLIFKKSLHFKVLVKLHHLINQPLSSRYSMLWTNGYLLAKNKTLGRWPSLVP